MKIQGNKSELSPVKTPDAEDIASLSISMPSDYFSSLISTVLMAPPSDTGSEEQTDVTDVVDETKENNQAPVNFDYSFDSIINQYQTHSSQQTSINITEANTLARNDSGNTGGQFLPSKNMYENNIKNNQTILPTPQLDHSKNTDINTEIDALLANEDESVNQDVMKIIQSSQQDARQLMDNALQYQVPAHVNVLTNQEQHVPQALSPQIKAMLNQSNEKVLDVNEKFDIKGMRQAELTQNMQDMRHQIDAASPVTIYTLQKGQVNVLENKRNQYVDALAQLGAFMNEETAKLTTVDVGVAAAPQTNSSYAAIFKTINQSEYDIKIDLMPQTLDAILKEAYQANIKIYPPELGAVIAKLKLEKNKAELVILTENNRVKEVVESNLPQLRESFKNSDINLTNISVNVENSQSGNDRQDSQAQSNKGKDAIDVSDESIGSQQSSAETKQHSPQRLNALVDTYA